MLRLVAVLALIACSSKSAAPPPSATGSSLAPATPPPSTQPVAQADAAPPPVPVASCIVREAPDGVVITPTTVDYCAGEGATRSCWHVDLATKHVEARPVAAKVEGIGTLRNATRNPDGSVAICTKPGVCSTVKPPFVVAETDVLGASVDGSILVKGSPEVKALELYDVATWKLRAKIAPWKTAMGSPAPLPDFTFAGPNLIAWANASPVSSQGRIYTLAGKLVATIGDKDFSQNVVDSWPTQDLTWLFKQLDSTRLIAVDVATGKLVKTYDLAPLAANTDDPYVGAAGVAASADTIVYLSGSGVVGVIARATGAIDVLSPPTCK